MERRSSDKAVVALVVALGLAIAAYAWHSTPSPGPAPVTDPQGQELGGGQAVAPVYIGADLPTLVAHSKAIILARVTDQHTELAYESTAGQRYVVTVSTVEVERIYAGTVPSPLDVEAIGGQAEGVETIGEGEAQLIVGESYVLFLGEGQTGRPTPWGGSPGAARVARDGTLSTRYPAPWLPTTLSALEAKLQALGVQ